MEKQVRLFQNTTQYLLGRFRDGDTFWLTEPSWNCDWYWGAGYIHTVHSHQHYNGLCFKKPERYDSSARQLILYSEYVHILSDHPEVYDCVLTESEQWQLSDYFKSVYALKETAEIFGRGHSYLTDSVTKSIQDKELAHRINTVELPKLFASIAELLTPKVTT